MTILLRTLTEKSTIGFGPHGDMTVYQLISMNYFRVLQNMYFKLSMINFTDDVLNTIGVGAEFRISKPGKNIKFFEDNKEKMVVSLDLKTLMITRNNSKCRLDGRRRSVNYGTTKAKLKYKNQRG